MSRSLFIANLSDGTTPRLPWRFRRALAQGCSIPRDETGAARAARCPATLQAESRIITVDRAVGVCAIRSRQTVMPEVQAKEQSTMKVWPGKPYPLGATWDGAGVNFSAVLRKCRQGRALFVRFVRRAMRAAYSAERTDRIKSGMSICRKRAGAVIRLSRARTLRAEQGHRFNPAKLLLDPYAKAIAGNDPVERRICSVTRSAIPMRIFRADDQDSAPACPGAWW